MIPFGEAARMFKRRIEGEPPAFLVAPPIQTQF